MMRRILVVDDSTPIQKVIKIAFSKYLVEIRAASSLSEAIKECEHDKPDLIIADASLPGVSTASDFSRLLAKSHGAAMVMLMGSYDSVRESDLRAAGFETLVKKPFDAVELLEACERIMPGKLQPAGGHAPSSGGTNAGVRESGAQSLSLKAQIPSFLLDQDDSGKMPSPPKLETSQKGRPAFDAGFGDDFLANDSSLTSQINRSQIVSPPSGPVPVQHPLQNTVQNTVQNTMQNPAMNSHQLRQMAEELVRSELPHLVNRALEKYCQDNFKDIAREVLTAELRRLADEKARYLVDQ